MSRRSFHLCLLLALTISTTSTAVGSSGYQRPSAPIAAEIDRTNVTVAQVPSNIEQLSPDKRWLYLLVSRRYAPIADMAGPVWRPRNQTMAIKTRYWRSGIYDRWSIGLQLLDVDSGEVRDVVLPQGAQITSPKWSPDGHHLAFLLYRGGPGELWVLDTATNQAQALTNAEINALNYPHFVWAGNDYLIYHRLVQALEPRQDGLPPEGPEITESFASEEYGFQGVNSSRSLPLSKEERRMAEQWRTSELIATDLDGRRRPLGVSGVALQIDASPDGRYLLVTRVAEPFESNEGSARRIDLYERGGRHLRTMLDRPDPVRAGGWFDNTIVPPGPRQIAWVPIQPATLQWVEREEAGESDSGVRDTLYQLAAPFKGTPQTLYRSDRWLVDVYWRPDRGFLALESRASERRSRLIAVDNPGNASSRVLVEYPAPPDGAVIPRIAPLSYPSPLLVPGSYGRPVLNLDANGRTVLSDYWQTKVVSLDLASAHQSSLHVASGDSLFGLLDPHQGTALVVRKAHAGQPAQLLRRGLRSSSEQILYRDSVPRPVQHDRQRVVVQATRSDGLPLSAKVYLPPGWMPEQGPLPALFWVYALRYEDRTEYDVALARRAAIPEDDDESFIRNMRIMTLAGYAVVDYSPPILPKRPGQSPYDADWNDQMVESTRTMLDHLAQMGIVDPQRVAVGGQSGGGYTTANLLAHSNLFKAGVACNGLYNRSLSPFGVALFQEKTLWQARDSYVQMSPFFFADQIKAPLLILKGQVEEHPSIQPTESANLYAALKGLGKTARYVEFPLEGHSNIGYESVMHQLWEIEQWLGRYIGPGWKRPELKGTEQINHSDGSVVHKVGRRIDRHRRAAALQAN